MELVVEFWCILCYYYNVTRELGIYNKEACMNMLITELPEDFTDGGKVYKCMIDGEYELQSLDIGPYTSIQSHKHVKEWEAWIRFDTKEVYICRKGESHALHNLSGRCVYLMAIKGKKDYSYNNLAFFFEAIGFKVYSGNLEIR